LKVAADANNASPIAVRPFELRDPARTLAAKAAPLAVSLTRVHGTMIACLSRSDHSSISTSIAPSAPFLIVAITPGSSKARAMPSC
jgi:hypothetical protein